MCSPEPMRYRVLLVEDDHFMAQDLADQLSAMGVNVVGPVSTVADALVLAGRTDKLDGAVLDIKLGGQFVFPVVDYLAARGVPVVFATGYSRQRIDSRYWHIPHFQKPYVVADVLNALVRIGSQR